NSSFAIFSSARLTGAHRNHGCAPPGFNMSSNQPVSGADRSPAKCHGRLDPEAGLEACGRISAAARRIPRSEE
ncbi:MAG: hypothetical protein ACLGHY_04230, partial [Gammaproteobacteria bacterium]